MANENKRLQRDRYLIEYVLDQSLKGDLLQIGMTNMNRFQFTGIFYERA